MFVISEALFEQFSFAYSVNINIVFSILDIFYLHSFYLKSY